MSTRPGSSTNRSSYFTDPESASEMARLTRQAHLLTEVMGGPLSEPTDLAAMHDILDLACGPGAWVLEVAATHRDKQVTGVDISQLMIDYANFQASQHAINNAHFRVMDILRPLEFPDNAFDLINVRLIASFMFRSRDNWPRLLNECMRILRPRGIIQLTDCEWFISNSPTTETLFGLCTRAIHLAGNTFSPDGRHLAVTPMLGRLLRNVDCQNIQHRAFAVDCSHGSKSYQSYYEDMRVFLKSLLPLLVHTKVATAEEADSLYHSTLEEMRAENFNCLWYYLTAWGTKGE